MNTGATCIRPSGQLTSLDLLRRLGASAERVQAHVQLCPPIPLVVLEALQHFDSFLWRPHRVQADIAPVPDRDVDLRFDHSDLVRDRRGEVRVFRIRFVGGDMGRVRDPERLVEPDFADLSCGILLQPARKLIDKRVY